MAVITVRIPEALRKRMRKLKAVNWSAVVRGAIENRLSFEAKKLERDWERARRASKITDEIFEEMRERYGHVEYDSTETIRYWRERRFGRS